MVSSVLLGSVNILGGLIFGYNSGIIAVVGDNIATYYGFSAGIQGLFTASILIGCMIGSLFGGAFNDRFGRKLAILTVGAFGTAGPIFCAFAPDEPTLFIARGVVGISVGLATVACPTYVSENARVENKGALGTLFQLAITFGIFISYFMGLPFEHTHYSAKQIFSYQFLIGVIPGAILFLLGIFMPESDYWKGSRREQDALLPSKRGSIQAEPTFGDLFRPPARRSLFVGILLAVAQQLTGINAFMYYAPTIFKAAGFGDNTTWPTIGLGGWNFLTTFICTFLVDRLGRRPLLLIGTSLMAAGCVGLALTYQFAHHLTLGILSIVMLFVFIMGFEMGQGPLFWVVCTELFQPEIKGPALSVLNTVVQLFNLFLTFSFLPLNNKIHLIGVSWIFGGIGVVCVIMMIFYLPETKKSNVIGSNKKLNWEYTYN